MALVSHVYMSTMSAPSKQPPSTPSHKTHISLNPQGWAPLLDSARSATSIRLGNVLRHWGSCCGHGDTSAVVALRQSSQSEASRKYSVSSASKAAATCSVSMLLQVGVVVVGSGVVVVGSGVVVVGSGVVVVRSGVVVAGMQLLVTSRLNDLNVFWYRLSVKT